MARDHARIYSRIWADDDFKSLRCDVQRAYLLALSQPGMTWCGVVPYTPKRWARLAADSDPASLDATIATLQQRGYVLVDTDTEEMWIRSFVKNDEVLRSPNVVKALIEQYRTILSPRIRAAFVAELEQLQPRSDSERTGWQTALQAMHGEPAQRFTATPPETVPETPPPTPSRNPSQKGSANGSRNGSANPPHATRPSARPAPATTPAPTPVSDGPDGKPPVDENEANAGALVGEYIDACAERPPGAFLAPLGREIKRHLRDGVHPDLLRTALTQLRNDNGDPTWLRRYVNNALQGQPGNGRGGKTPTAVLDRDDAAAWLGGQPR